MHQNSWDINLAFVCDHGQSSVLSQRCLICASPAPNCLCSENSLSANTIKPSFKTHACPADIYRSQFMCSTVSEQREKYFCVVVFQAETKFRWAICSSSATWKWLSYVDHTICIVVYNWAAGRQVRWIEYILRLHLVEGGCFSHAFIRCAPSCLTGIMLHFVEILTS